MCPLGTHAAMVCMMEWLHDAYRYSDEERAARPLSPDAVREAQFGAVRLSGFLRDLALLKLLWQLDTYMHAATVRFFAEACRTAQACTFAPPLCAWASCRCNGAMRQLQQFVATRRMASSLVCYHMSEMYFGSNAESRLPTNVLHELSKCRSMAALSFDGHRVPAAEAPEVARALCSIVRMCDELVYLDLTGQFPTPETSQPCDAVLGTVVAHAHKLKYLVLDECNFSPHALARLAHCSSLTHLDLSFTSRDAEAADAGETLIRRMCARNPRFSVRLEGMESLAARVRNACTVLDHGGVLAGAETSAR